MRHAFQKGYFSGSQAGSQHFVDDDGMSNNLYSPSMHISTSKEVRNMPVTNAITSSAANLFHRVMLMRQYNLHYPKPSISPVSQPLPVRPTASPHDTPRAIFDSVQSNIVQSIRAFKGQELLRAAKQLGHHFLYAKGSEATTRAEMLSAVATSMLFPKPCGKNYEALRTALTEAMDKAGPQPGFVIMLEGLPATQKFDKDARETLLDVFRDAAEFWARRKVCFRVFYSFVLTSNS